MPSADLTQDEWNFIITVLATKLTWAEANPILTKLGEQLKPKQSFMNPVQTKGDGHVLPTQS